MRVHQVRVLRDELVANKGKLESAREQKKVSLDSLTAQERADAEEIDGLQAVSADLAAKIRAAQAHSTVQHVSGAGFIWPVNAPITSPFGWRWGRLHEGSTSAPRTVLRSPPRQQVSSSTRAGRAATATWS